MSESEPTVAELSDTALIALARWDVIALTTAALESLDKRLDRDGELKAADIVALAQIGALVETQWISEVDLGDETPQSIEELFGAKNGDGPES